jgi:hypothetical protein
VADGDSELLRQLKEIVEETAAGDPMSPLKWTDKSTRTIASELTRSVHAVSNVTVGRCLEDMGYTLRANVKTSEGHSLRIAMLSYLNRQVKSLRRRQVPLDLGG